MTDRFSDPATEEESMDQCMRLFQKGCIGYAADYNWILRNEWGQGPRNKRKLKWSRRKLQLRENGRRAVLGLFGLWNTPFAPTLEELRKMSPRVLLLIRRQL